MRKLSTYFALLATLLALLCGVIVLVVAHVRQTVDLQSVVLLLVLSLALFLFALAIGFFVSRPLEDLLARIRAYRAGDATVDFGPRGSLQEADDLAAEYARLIDSHAAQSADLARREKQQLQFVGDVAHELRTPLTAIHGTAELLGDPDLPPEMRQRFCNTVVSESERLTRMVNDLLSLQHIEGDEAAHTFARLNLRDVAQGAVDALQPVLEERGCACEIVGEAPDVLGNRDRLAQVVTNLVDNASRFTPNPGGHVRVELYGVGENSVLAVKDNGTGFGDTDPALLFERFFRTDFSRARNTGGSGLGLSIVKSVVEAHDGTVEAYNLPEGGACFIVAIPSVAA